MYKDDAELMTNTIRVLQATLEAQTTPLDPIAMRNLAYNVRLLCRDASYYFEAMYDPGIIVPACRTDEQHARLMKDLKRQNQLMKKDKGKRPRPREVLTPNHEE